MMGVDSVPGQSFALRFRHLAGELRRADGHPNDDREFERLLMRMTRALRDSFDRRQLPGPILNALDDDKSSGLNLFWELQLAISVVGYWNPFVFTEPYEEYDDETRCGGQRAVFLKPGPVSLVWPGVFEDILCHDGWCCDDIDLQAIFSTALTEQRFTIMGYYATACDLLAEWIEKNVGSEESGSPEVPSSLPPLPLDARRIASQMRALASEYREFRRHGTGRLEEMQLGDKFYRLLKSAYSQRLLPNLILDKCDSYSSGRGILLKDKIVGYMRIDQFTDTIGDVTHTYSQLHPGWIADLWPDQFDPIHCVEPENGDTDKEVAYKTKLLHRFAHLGYHATTCDLLAEWIENNTDDDRGDQAVEPVAAMDRELPDGLSPDGRTLRWARELYPLGPSAAGVVKLLVDAYFDGFPFLHEDYLKENGGTETDMRRLVPDNGLSAICVRQQSRDGKQVKGMWGLIDPKKLLSAQKVHG